MKRKSLFLSLKKYTVASFDKKNNVIGAGQTGNGVCPTVDPLMCKTDEPHTSCLTSNTDPLSNARQGCASHVGGGDSYDPNSNDDTSVKG